MKAQCWYIENMAAGRIFRWVLGKELMKRCGGVGWFDGVCEGSEGSGPRGALWPGMLGGPGEARRR